MPRSSPKPITSIYGPTAREIALQVRQMDVHQAVEKLVCPAGIAGQEHQEVVDAVEQLADLQQVAAEQADDGAIGLAGGVCCAPSAKTRSPSGPAGKRAGRRSARHTTCSRRAPRAAGRDRPSPETASSIARSRSPRRAFWPARGRCRIATPIACPAARAAPRPASGRACRRAASSRPSACPPGQSLAPTRSYPPETDRARRRR